MALGLLKDCYMITIGAKRKILIIVPYFKYIIAIKIVRVLLYPLCFLGASRCGGNLSWLSILLCDGIGGSEGNEGKTSKVRGKKTAKIPHSLTSLTANYDASFR